MLEIVVLILLTNNIGKTVEAKGYKSGKYKWMTVGLWFAGEIVGGIIGTIIGVIVGDQDSARCIAYIVALLGAIAGAVIANAIANNLKPIQASPSTNPPANIAS